MNFTGVVFACFIAICMGGCMGCYRHLGVIKAECVNLEGK